MSPVLHKNEVVCYSKLKTRIHCINSRSLSAVITSASTKVHGIKILVSVFPLKPKKSTHVLSKHTKQHRAIDCNRNMECERKNRQMTEFHHWKLKPDIMNYSQA